MKTLTIREPWASLIIEGYKKYEFRSWKTDYRGKILIHTSLSIEKDNVNKFRDYNITYVRGAIIGEVTLVDCILVDNKFEESLNNVNPIVYGKSKHARKYAWQLDDIIKYYKPIYCKGQLGLWNYDKE